MICVLEAEKWISYTKCQWAPSLPGKLWLATALNEVSATARLEPESSYLDWECIGLDSTDSSGKTQELANRNSRDPFSLSLRWTSDSNFPAQIWNWKEFVPGNDLNGAHPTGNLQWDLPCEIQHCNRLTPLKTSLDSHHGLALNLKFKHPALPHTPEHYSTVNHCFTFNSTFTQGSESILPISEIIIPIIPFLGGK